MTTNLTAHRLVAEDLERKLASMGWPLVNTEDLMAGTFRPGILGPGEENWRSYMQWAPTAQLRHLRQILEYSPSVAKVPDEKRQ